MAGRKSSRAICVAALFVGASILGWGTPAADPAEYDPDRPVVDLAICLDTSNSMERLLDAARLELWNIVNELALAEPTPRLRVALLTYGNAAHSRHDGWVKVESPLTEDLDSVYQRLFELTARGREEYVGRVLEAAVKGLDWDESYDALKLIFVAGNEKADQDPQVNFEHVTLEAKENDLIVNAIYCGNAGHNDADSWKKVAELAGSEFAAIDHRSLGATVATPFDTELAELSAAINATYVPLGDRGQQGQQNQVQQDRNAESLGPATVASRAQAKSSPLYSTDWDLLDQLQKGKTTLAELDESELPEPMRQLTPDEREIYVEELTLRREQLGQQIAELSRKRRAYVSDHSKAKGGDDSSSFGAVFRRTLVEKGKEKGLNFPDR